MSRYPPSPPMSSASDAYMSATTGLNRRFSKTNVSRNPNPSRSTQAKPTGPILDSNKLDRREAELCRTRRGKWPIKPHMLSGIDLQEQLAKDPSLLTGIEVSKGEPRNNRLSESRRSGSQSSKHQRLSDSSLVVSKVRTRKSDEEMNVLSTEQYSHEGRERVGDPIGSRVYNEPSKFKKSQQLVF